MITITSGVMVAVIIAVCQAVKMAGLKGQYIPLLAVVLGFLGGWFILKDLSIIASIVAGLASVGLWEFGAKAVAIAGYKGKK